MTGVPAPAVAGGQAGVGRSLGAAGPSRLRPAWVEVDVAAVRHNAAVLAAMAAPAELCAVVKADGYGHGAVAVARAALAGGARWLAVATVDEGVALRDAGLTEPVLLLSEPAPDAMAEAWRYRLVPTLYSEAGVAAARRAVAASDGAGGSPGGGSSGGASSGGGSSGGGVPGGGSSGGGVPGGGVPATPWPVHLKVDTGMHRVGADPYAVGPLADLVAGAPELALAGLWTHLAVADGSGAVDRAFTDAQLDTFAAAAADLAARGHRVPMRHAANSAGAMAHPRARFDMVRCGIALYGLAPGPDLAGQTADLGLRPALSWRARVSHVRHLPAGARPSYGRARPLPADATVAVVPVGYADGVPRAYFPAGGTVIVGGEHRPLAGVVTMDQIVVDCGPGSSVAVGDEVVLVGRQGAAESTAWDWARVLGTIAYEVVCGIGARVPRVVVEGDPGGGGADPDEGGSR